MVSDSATLIRTKIEGSVVSCYRVYIKYHFDIIHARGSLFTDIEPCEATATGESGVRSLPYLAIVYEVAKQLKCASMRMKVDCAPGQCNAGHKV